MLSWYSFLYQNSKMHLEAAALTAKRSTLLGAQTNTRSGRLRRSNARLLFFSPEALWARQVWSQSQQVCAVVSELINIGEKHL